MSRSRRTTATRPAAERLPDGGREILIRGNKFVPPRLVIAALTPGEVGGEILGVNLPPGPVERELVQRQALNLDDQDGLVAVGVSVTSVVSSNGGAPLPFRQESSDSLVVTSTAVRVALFHATGALPVIGFDVQAELSAGAQVALDPCVPAGQVGWTGDC